jgi:tripartite-type tricarboxylate transporter receptor subunit TctC
MKRRTSLSLLLLGSALPLGALAQQDFPKQPIKIIAPYPPAGTTDLFARSIGEYLQRSMGQPVFVENRPGSSGMIGAGMVARAPADGYTLLIGSQALYAVHPTLYEKLPYNPARDFTPISLIARLPSYVAVPADLPVSTLPEFMKYVRDNPGKVSYGSAGNGTAQHIYVELFKQQANLDMTHIPYKGSAPMVMDLMAGRVQAVMDFGPSLLPHAKAGKIKLLAVSTRERAKATPEVPTMHESGVPNFDASTWFAIHGPGGMPASLVNKLSTEIRAALRDPQIRARLEAAGTEPVGTTAEELLAVQTRDNAKLGEVIRRANIKAD